MKAKLPHIDFLLAKMMPTLRSMEKRREDVIIKFRPLMMVFAGYTMICFLMPYLDFGVPRHFRGNLFYFLLTIGGLSFSVVVAIYYRAYKDLQSTLDQQFYAGLSKHLAEEVNYLNEAPGFDAHLEHDLLGTSYNHFEARNLMQGKLGEVHFSFVQAAVEHRYVASIRSDQSIFKGFVLSFELPVFDGADIQVFGRSHPKFGEWHRRSNSFGHPDRPELNARYWYFSNTGAVPTSALIRSFLELDEEMRLLRMIRNDLVLTIRNGRLTLAIAVYDRLWEMVNWKPFYTKEFLTVKLMPFVAGIKLVEVFKTPLE